MISEKDETLAPGRRVKTSTGARRGRSPITQPDPEEPPGVTIWKNRVTIAVKKDMSAIFHFPYGGEERNPVYTKTTRSELNVITEFAVDQSDGSSSSSSSEEPEEQRLDNFIREYSQERAHAIENFLGLVTRERNFKSRRQHFVNTFTKYIGRPPVHMTDERFAEEADQVDPLLPMQGFFIQQRPSVHMKKSQTKQLRLMAALRLHMENQVSIPEAARKHGINRQSLTYAKRLHRQGRLDEYLERLAAGRTDRPPRFDAGLDRFIWQQLRSVDGRLTAKQLKHIWQMTHPASPAPSLTTILQRIKKLGLSKKKVPIVHPRRNLLLNKERSFRFLVQLFEALDSGRKVICLDESSVNFATFRGTHYAPYGQTWAASPESLRDENVSLVLATSQTGAEQALFIKGSCCSVAFFYFIRRLHMAVPEFQAERAEDRPLIIIDNATVHRAKPLTRYCRIHKIQLLFTPPYHPMLNPVEFAFGVIKGHLSIGPPLPQ